MFSQCCVWLCDSMNFSTPGSPVLPYLPEFAQIHGSTKWTHVTELMILSNHLILCHPLLLLPSVFSSIRVFCSELVLHFRWPQHWSFSIRPFNEYSGLISFRIDWFDLVDVQGTLKSLLQHHNLKASILWCSTFFMVQVSHPYMTIEKAIALTMWTSVGKAMSQLLNMLFKFVSFPSKAQESFNFMVAVTIGSDLGAQGNKICHCCHFSPFYLP